MARRSRHTTAPTSRMHQREPGVGDVLHRGADVDVLPGLVGQDLLRAPGSAPASSARSAGSRSATRSRSSCVGAGHAAAICSAASAGMMPQPRLGRGQRGEDVQPALQPGAFLEDLRQLGRAPQVGVLLRVAQAGAHVGSHSLGQRRQRLGDLGQRGPPRHDHTAVRRPRCGSRAGSTWSASLRCRRSASAGRCPPAGRARRRTTRGSAATAHSRSASIRAARAARPGSRWSHRRRTHRRRGTAAGSSPTLRVLRQVVELDDVGDQLDRRQVLGQGKHALRLVEQLRGVRRGHLANRDPQRRRVDDEADVPVPALHHDAPFVRRAARAAACARAVGIAVSTSGSSR